MNPIKAAFELGYILRQSERSAECFVLALLHDARCYAALNDVAKEQLGLDLNLPIPSKVVSEEYRAPMSYCQEAVGKLTRKELVLIQASGIWLAANRRMVSEYKAETWNGNPRCPELTPMEYNRFGKAEAIKFVREELGIGLCDAKKLVEEHCSPFKD